MNLSFVIFLLSPLFILSSHSLPSQKQSVHKRSLDNSPFIDISTTTTSSPLPLTRLPILNSNNQHLHPQIIHQQHINRSIRRHARMTKREIPSEEELSWKLRKRMNSIEGGSLRKRQRLSKAAASMKTLDESVQPNSFVVDGSTGFSKIDSDASRSNSVKNALTPTGINSLGLAIEANDVGYFATIQVGTPLVDYKVLMDSGSADFFLPSTACSTCGTHTRLGSKTSSSFVAGDTDFSVTYGTGKVSGTLVTDNVVIAGLNLKSHSFGVTTTESPEFGSNSISFDGLMGLAKSILSEQKVPTPIESLAKSGIVASSQMGYHLARLSDGTNDGEITFGGVDASKFIGRLTEFPNVNKVGFWEGNLDDVSVNGVSLNLKGRTAILDTGTSLIVIPAADAAAIHAVMPGAESDGQGGFTVPCTLTSSIAFSFGGTAFSIDPQDITFLPITNDLKGQCTSGISVGNVGSTNQWLVGDVFLKNVYFATDIASNSIGLAPSLTV